MNAPHFLLLTLLCGCASSGPADDDDTGLTWGDDDDDTAGDDDDSALPVGLHSGSATGTVAAGTAAERACAGVVDVDLAANGALDGYVDCVSADFTVDCSGELLGNALDNLVLTLSCIDPGGSDQPPQMSLEGTVSTHAGGLSGAFSGSLDSPSSGTNEAVELQIEATLQR